MSERTTIPPTDEMLQELGDKGQAIYEKLKPILEPAHDRQFVAIHVDTEDYAIGRSSSVATRLIRQRHPADGRLFIRKIGDEPEYHLAARILASEMRAGHTK
jgi:hypothetical protein